jgi:hypothetical protein
VLRATGQNAPHSLGSIGVQYLIWNVPTKADLEHLTASLRQRSAYQETRTDGDVTVVEGRDPDDLVIMLMHSGGSKAAMRRLPSRIYAW